MLTADERTINDQTFDELMSRHWSTQMIYANSHTEATRIIKLCIAWQLDQKGENTPAVLLVDPQAVSGNGAQKAVTHFGDGSVFPLPGREIVVISSGKAPELHVPANTDRQRVKSLPLIGAVALLVLLVGAKAVSAPELDACAGTACVGRPATFITAFYWLTERLISGDPNGISAATWSGRFVGILASLFGWFFFGTVITWAIGRSIQRAQELPADKVREFNAEHRSKAMVRQQTDRTKSRRTSNAQLVDRADDLRASMPSHRTYLVSVGALAAAAVAGYGLARATARRRRNRKIC